MRGLVAVAGGVFGIAVALVVGFVAVLSPGEQGAGAAAGAGQVSAVPAEYRSFVEQAGQRCAEISAPLIAAQINNESAWNATAVSPAGAEGMTQFMPGTWAAYGVDGDDDGTANPFDPADAIASQGNYMCALAAMVRPLVRPGVTLVQLALAAYNAGPARVLAAHGIPQIPETQGYVQRILSDVGNYSGADGTSGDPQASSGLASKEIAFAVAQLGTDYAYGGGTLTDPSPGLGGGAPGWDCSSLTRAAIYAATGGKVILARTTFDQVHQGRAVARANRQPGDLVFFDLPGQSNPAHVGIYVGGGRMIEAPHTGAKVRYADVDKGYYAHVPQHYRRIL